MYRGLPVSVTHWLSALPTLPKKIPDHYRSPGRGAQRMYRGLPVSVTHWLSALPTRNEMTLDYLFLAIETIFV